ncbi:MAG: conjugal transfer protein TraX [Lachnospiraceae bacterium]|nr:conjugal transfer protein TraX [Lachnospiraceae bacterium]
MQTLDSLSTSVNNFRQRYGFSGAMLKMFAVISMLIDHTGATVLRALYRLPAVSSDPAVSGLVRQLYYYSRRIGRLAFPIFCFLLVEGFLHTRNVGKYAVRLFIFALISDIPFDYALHPGAGLFYKQNVYFTLLIGILVLWGVREMNGRIPFQLIFMCAGMIMARIMRTDYSYRGVFVIEMLYILRFSPLLQSLGGAAIMEYEKMPTPLAFVPVYLYNGKRGRQMKYFFYWFYPAHLLILGLITNVLIPAMK